MNLIAKLTKREIQVAELIAWGATKKDVMNKLFISEHTVENHTRHIYEKTGVTKATELSAWWFCKHFNISLDLSPLKRKVLAYSIMLLVCVNIAFDNHDLLRIRRSRKNKENEIEQIIYE